MLRVNQKAAVTGILTSTIYRINTKEFWLGLRLNGRDQRNWCHASGGRRTAIASPAMGLDHVG
jgi:hypothetical protein